MQIHVLGYSRNVAVQYGCLIASGPALYANIISSEFFYSVFFYSIPVNVTRWAFKKFNLHIYLKMNYLKIIITA